MQTWNAGRARDGFTLIEVVVAMVLLSTVLVMLAGMTFHTAQQSVELHSTGARQALMLQEVNRMSSIPYDDVAGEVGCRTLGSGDGLEYTGCVTSTVSGNNAVQVQIVMTPVRSSMIRPDTVRFIRSQPPTRNPLCNPSC